MSEPEDQRPPVLDYQEPTEDVVPAESDWLRYVPGTIAVALLALGLLAVLEVVESECLPLGLLGSIFFALLQVLCGVESEPDRTGRRRCRVLRVPMLLGIVTLVVGVAIYCALPTYGAASERSNRVKCASNLRQVGQGIALYANDFGGAYPPSVVNLLTECDLNAEVFLCPCGDETKAQGPTAKAIAEDLARPGHISFVYLGAGMHRSKVTPDMVIAYEELVNHRKDGINALYGDGQVKWLHRHDAEHLISELKAGRNPPR